MIPQSNIPHFFTRTRIRQETSSKFKW